MKYPLLWYSHSLSISPSVQFSLRVELFSLKYLIYDIASSLVILYVSSTFPKFLASAVLLATYVSVSITVASSNPTAPPTIAPAIAPGTPPATNPTTPQTTTPTTAPTIFQKFSHQLPFSSILLTGSLPQYAYRFNPITLDESRYSIESGVTNLNNTGL